MAANRRKLTDTARQFLETGDTQASTPNTQPTVPDPVVPPATVASKLGSSLRAEILGDPSEAEASIRFTVDIPRSLHKRLEQLSIDSGKPKTELTRIILKRALDEMSY